MSAESTPGPTRAQIVTAAVVALVSACLGFALTWGGVRERGQRVDVPSLDRRLAESGRVNRPADTAARPGAAPDTSLGSVPPARTEPQAPAGGGMAGPAASSQFAAAWPAPPGMVTPVPAPSPASASASPSPRPLVTRLQPPGLGDPRNYPGGTRTGRRSGGSGGAPPPPGGAGGAAPEATSGGSAEPAGVLPYPPAPERRRAPGNLVDAWAREQAGYVVVQGFPESRGFPMAPGAESLEPVASGVTLDLRGLAVVSTASGRLGNYLVGGQAVGGEVVGESPALGLALVQLGARQVSAPDLAPGPVTPGEELALGPGFESGGMFQRAVAVRRLPGGLFQFRGLMTPAAGGAPLINRRRELAGVALARPPGYPGNGYGLAVDSSVLYRMLQTGSVNPPGAAEAALDGPGGLAASQLRGLLARDLHDLGALEGGRRSTGRIVPGRSLGIYRIGMSEQDLLRELGVGQVGMDAYGFLKMTYPVHNLEFTLMEGRVVAIATTDPFYATSKGVSVGVAWSGKRAGPELSDALVGVYWTNRQQYVAPGLEVEVGPTGQVTRMLVTSDPGPAVAQGGTR